MIGQRVKLVRSTDPRNLGVLGTVTYDDGGEICRYHVTVRWDHPIICTPGLVTKGRILSQVALVETRQIKFL